MKIETIRKRARANTLEVEHILAAARERIPGLRQELLQLSDEHRWSPTPFPAEGIHVVPLAKWAEIAGVYAEGGIPALQVLAEQEENHTYIIALLVEVHSQDAAQALFDLFAAVLDAPSWDCEVVPELVDALNSLFSLPKSLTPSDQQAAGARSFLMKLFAMASTTTQRGHVVCALRGVGDHSTVNFLSTLDAFPYPWEGIEKQALRAVRTRLRSDT
jgi:hypothetical protein